MKFLLQYLFNECVVIIYKQKAIKKRLNFLHFQGHPEYQLTYLNPTLSKIDRKPALDFISELEAFEKENLNKIDSIPRDSFLFESYLVATGIGCNTDPGT